MGWLACGYSYPGQDLHSCRYLCALAHRGPEDLLCCLHDERSAQSRLEDILGSETRNAIAKHDLIEIVRTDKNRQPMHDETLKGGPTGAIGLLPPIVFGRQKIEDE